MKEVKSRIDEGYERGLDGSQRAYRPQNDEIAQLEEGAVASSAVPDQQGSLPEAESTPQNTMNYTGTGNSGAKKKQVSGKSFFRRRSTWIGGGGIAGVATAVIIAVLGPSLMLENLTMNAVETNDTRSSILDIRLIRAIENKFSSEKGTVCKIKTAKCNLGRVPNNMLRELAKQGITPLQANGNPMEIPDGNGYAETSPDRWEFTDADGKSKTITSNQLVAEYKNNPKFRGTFKKAFNMRYRGWTGKLIAKTFYGKYGIERKGGAAVDNVDGKAATARSTIESKLSSGDTPDKTSSAMVENFAKEKLTKVAKRIARTGDPVLMAVGGTCMAVRAPTMFAGIVRSLEMAKLLILVSDTILSPAGMVKAGDMTAEGMSGIGEMLTEQVDGKSALDSPILLAAIGVNTNKVTPSEKFVPGLSIYNNAVVKASSALDGVSKEGCDMATSPQAAVASASISAASMGTGPGGVIYNALKGAIKVVVFIGAMDAAIDLISPVVGEIAKEVCKYMCDAVIASMVDNINGARGEELGDALGTAIPLFFSSGALATGSAVLSENQAIAYAQQQDEINNQYRQEDIALLSPFDVSSKYTFLGSIVNGFAISSAGYSNSIHSTLASVGSALSSPFSFINSTANAASVNLDCYDNIFDNTSACLDFSGSPRTGIPVEYLSMDREEVFDLATDGKCNNESGCDAINVETGEINMDSENELSDVASTCSQPAIDEYEGCMIQSGSGSSETQRTFDVEGDNGSESITVEGINSPSLDDKKSASYFLYQIDQSVENILAGEDEEEAESGSSSVASGDIVSPLASGFTVTGSMGPRVSPCAGCSTWHQGTDFINSGDTSVYAMAGGVVIAANSTINNIVSIRHTGADNLITHYYHMESADILVKEGDTVTAGQKIGKIGNAGQSTGAHLHFEIDISEVADKSTYSKYGISTGGWAAGNRINPELFLKDKGAAGF